ncbi:MAG: glycosyltransferase family 4 protein [Acidobacteria bacterium]|nr:glycosyltransferase family 4 protein [Acidobacteriota bacterium]
MARIAVVTSSPPFAEGGHLVLARAVVDALHQAGHESSLVVTPQNRFGRQAAEYLATWLTDVGLTGDGRPVHQVISLRYPSYAVRHPQHVCWHHHTMREYYDQWPLFSAPLSWKGRIKERIRQRLVRAADRYFLTRHVKRLFALSRTVQQRLQQWGGIPSEVLYPPPPPRAYRCDEYGDYIFAVSRLTPLKRMDLIVHALGAPSASGIKCVIAGEGGEAGPLKELIAHYNLASRVRLLGRIDDDELVAHLARCRAVCFPPFDEDYGFVTVEAFAARKPVITCLDSGGAAELVDASNGLVCEPSPSSLADAMRQLMDDRALAERLGEAGHAVAGCLTWDATVRKLVIV